MPDAISTIAVTSVNVATLSRHDLLEWVNSTVHGKYQKIEELCSGTAYCQMMELLFPHCIGIKRVKMNPKMPHEYLHNLKLLQGAFIKVEFDKTVPIDRLIKGRFQDNFEFLQWFKKYFDTFAANKENLKVPAALVAAASNAPKPVRRPAVDNNTHDVMSTSSSSQLKQKKLVRQDTYNVSTTSLTEETEERCVSPSVIYKLQQIEELKAAFKDVEMERKDYLNRIVKLEKLMLESIDKNEFVELSKRVLKILDINKFKNV